jgi:hypothetical protein
VDINPTAITVKKRTKIVTLRSKANFVKGVVKSFAAYIIVLRLLQNINRKDRRDRR